MSVFLVFSILFSFGISTVYAEPRYSSTVDVTMRMTFSSNTASCYFKILGDINTTSISDVTVTIVDEDDNLFKSWNNLSSNSRSLTISENVSGAASGKTYTMSFSAKVHRGNSIEIVSDSRTFTYN